MNALNASIKTAFRLHKAHRELTVKEKTFRDTELKAGALINAVEESVWLSALDGTVLAANTTTAARLGTSIDELIGKKDLPQIPPHLTETRRRLIAEVIRTGAPLRFEDERNNIMFEHNLYPVKDSGGNITAVAAFSRDITGQRHRESEFSRLNRTLLALSGSSEAMMRASREADYLEAVCRVIVECCGYSMVWIGLAEEGEAKRVVPVAFAGLDEEYVKQVNITWADTERGRGPTGTAIRTGKPTIREVLNDPNFMPWREEALKRGYASILGLPLMNNDRAIGAITLYSPETNRFSEEEVKLLMRLSDDLAYGITTLRLHEERARAEEALAVKSHALEEMNTALKVLLNQREDDKRELEQTIRSNVERLVFPYLENLKEGGLTEQQKGALEVLEMNLKAITSPFLGPSRSKVPSLTPREIEIINLIRLGKTSKQIGTQLHLGKATIDFHRDRIRRKLGLTSDKADLRTYLLSLT
jgi:PAS domain S-box-containing protein